MLHTAFSRQLLYDQDQRDPVTPSTSKAFHKMKHIFYATYFVTFKVVLNVFMCTFVVSFHLSYTQFYE